MPERKAREYQPRDGKADLQEALVAMRPDERVWPLALCCHGPAFDRRERASCRSV